MPKMNRWSKCIVCGSPFKKDDKLQAFLRCPDNPDGSWTTPVVVDSGFQSRFVAMNDSIKRKHEGCTPI